MGITRVFTDPRSQHYKIDGVSVNSSGKLYFREPGANSTTMKNVYSDKDLSVPLLNPVTLDANGRAPEIFLSGDYNVQMTDSADVQIWRVDNYQPAAVDGQFGEWDSALTYAVNDYVRYTDGNYYISLSSGNAGNVPSSSPAYWSQAFFLTVYNSSTSYGIEEVIYYEGNIYTSLQSGNQGNTPDASFTYWSRPGVSVPLVSNYQGQIIKYIRTSTTSSLDLISILSSGLSESVGPTDSGADNIWTAMDEIPLNATSINLEVEATVTRTTGSSSAYSMTANFNGDGFTLVVKGASLLNYGSSTEPSAAKSVTVIDVPLSAANVFDVIYTATGADTEALFIKINGFSVEEA